MMQHGHQTIVASVIPGLGRGGGGGSLEHRLSVPDFSPKLQNKIQNGKPGFEARGVAAVGCTHLLYGVFYSLQGSDFHCHKEENSLWGEKVRGGEGEGRGGEGEVHA